MTGLVLAALTIAVIVYGASAGAKLRSTNAYRSYRQGLGQTTLVPVRLLPLTAAVLVGCETAVAASAGAAAVLTVTASSQAALLSTASLTVAGLLAGALTVGVTVVIRRGVQARCACFGSPSTRPPGKAHAIRNACLVAAPAVGLVATQFTSSEPRPTEAALAVAAGTVGGLLLIRLDELVELFTPMPDASGGRPG